MSFAYKLLPHYTYDDYCHWEGQWELIEGIPYAMSPMPRPEHQAVAGNLHAEFRAAIKGVGCNWNVYQPIDYKVAEDTVLNPDLLIVCKPITKQFLDFTPDLVVEIVSPATEPKDRHIKFAIYEQQQIRYYLIVDVPKNNVEIYTLGSNKKYERQPADLQQPFIFQLSDCSFAIILNAMELKKCSTVAAFLLM